MSVELDRSDLLEVLQKAKSATEKRSALPVLNNFLITEKGGELIVRATDLESYLEIKAGEVSSSFTCLVNADKLLGVVRGINSTRVNFEIDGQRLLVLGGRSKFKLALSDPEDFPDFPEPNFTNELRAVELLNASQKVEHAISKEDSRYALQGLYIHGKGGTTRFVGSDGHRLALYKLEPEVNIGVILPRKGLRVLLALLKGEVGSVQIGHDDSFIHLQGQDWRLSCRLLEGEYPDYDGVIPTNFNYEINLDRQELLECIKRLSVIAESSSFPIKLTFSQGKLYLEISDPEFGEGSDEMDADSSSEKIEIGFNGKYLIDALSEFSSQKVVFKLLDPDSPAVISSEEEPFMCIIMPMRL
ncbi:MAG: DNA polymerase III subunit beta [Aquificaceae bacterium]|nr:DNA polymerase III subunit beta [Aquificaceae bacterium]MDW8237673.1 DNA polymerase III subunit beta [Aquificaceae bacterium]